MKKESGKCATCRKPVVIKTWISRKGLLKSKTIASGLFCSKKCFKRFKLLILLNDILEELDK